jgi:hypothetical protein
VAGLKHFLFPTMASKKLLRVVPLLVGGVAVTLGLFTWQQKPMEGSASISKPEGHAPTQEETFCYEGVRTQDAELPRAKCFKVSGGVFTQVMGDAVNGTVETRRGYAIPGLWDGHGHLMQYGDFLNGVDLFGSRTLDEVNERILSYLDSNPSVGTVDNWVRGTGWDQTPFGRMPTAVRPTHPRAS